MLPTPPEGGVVCVFFSKSELLHSLAARDPSDTLRPHEAEKCHRIPQQNVVHEIRRGRPPKQITIKVIMGSYLPRVPYAFASKVYSFVGLNGNKSIFQICSNGQPSVINNLAFDSPILFRQAKRLSKLRPPTFSV